MNVPDDLLYTETHEWIKREGDNVRVGITDHAQAELTDVVYVELPKMDRQANAREAIAVVESVKAASDVFSPLTGEVVGVNSEIVADPALARTRLDWQPRHSDLDTIIGTALAWERRPGHAQP